MDFLVNKLFQSIGRKITGWVLGATREIDVPLDDDVLVRIAVIPTLAAEAASGRDSRLLGGYLDVVDRPPVTILEGMAQHLAAIQPFVRRCACHLGEPELGQVWEMKRTIPQRIYHPLRGMVEATGPVSVHGTKDNILDEVYACMPFLCVHRFEQLKIIKNEDPFLGTAATVAISEKPLMPYRGAEHFVDPSPFVHKDTCKRHLSADKSHILQDLMGPYYGERARHRYERLLNEVSCVWCNRDQLHALNRAVYTHDIKPSKGVVGDSWMRQAWFINRWLDEVHPEVNAIQVTAWDSAYCPITHIMRFLDHVFVLVGTVADHRAVLEAGMIPLLVYRAGNNSSLGCGRVYVACGVKVGVRVLVTNATAYYPLTLDFTLPPASPVETHGMSLMAPTVNLCWIVAGAVNISSQMTVTRAGVLSGQYAIEENFLMRSTVCVHRADHYLPLWITPMDLNPEYIRETPLVLRSVTTPRWAVAKGRSRLHSLVTRQVVLGWHASAAVGVGWTQASVLPLGKRVAVPPQEVLSAPSIQEAQLGEPTTLSTLIADEVGTITWVVMGSRGDVVPILALARRLREWGFRVDVVRPHTEEEGIEMLRGAENGDILSASPIFLRTLTHAMTAPGFVLGPPEVPGIHMGVSLRPPSDVVWPTDFGAGALVNFAIEYILRGWSPLVNVGAYRKARWLPRSANGETFLENHDGGTRDIPVALVWGSSTLPKPAIEGAVEPDTTDHEQFFRRCRLVVCHGGAGTVQTAAACGARVVSATVVLDRNYRNKTNAGLGVKAGADPDTVVLTMLPYYPKIWLWAYRHSWAMFLTAIRWGLTWIVGPSLWLMLALAFRTVRVALRFPSTRVVFTPSFMSTLIATLLSRWMAPWYAAFFASPVANTMSYVVSVLGATPLSIALSLANVFAVCSLNPLTWWLAVSGFGYTAIPITLLAGHFRVGTLIMVELLSLVIGAEEGSTDQTARVGISLAFPDLYLPAFHTRFISPDGTRVFEGTWVSGHRGLGALYQMRVRAFQPASTKEWVIPTRIPWSRILDAPQVSAPYSTLWNCQSGMLYAVRGMWGLFGVSLWFIAPMAVWMILASTVMTLATVVIIILLDVVPVVAIGMTAVGEVSTLAHTRAILYQSLQRLASANQSWFEAAVSITTGLSTGWDADTRADIACAQAIIRAESVEDLIHVCQLHRVRSTLNLQLYALKMDALRALSQSTYLCSLDPDHL